MACRESQKQLLSAVEESKGDRGECQIRRESLALLALEGIAWRTSLKTGKEFLNQKECCRAVGISPFQVPPPRPSHALSCLAVVRALVGSISGGGTTRERSAT